MASKELVGEGPLFLSVKEVRGDPLMEELKENIQNLRNENVIRFRTSDKYRYLLALCVQIAKF